MLLKRLELLGFKSFANRVAFEFESGISALVGPNGSGKSNVADAVRWVMGEQSARALRGKKAEEVIFVGSAGRHPLGMAEVALVLDNADARIAVDYAEIRLARRLYRSGESEYLINGARARRKDLVALLLEVGLHAEGYTVVGQGAVEELVMQRPEERRAVLEHAADISRHQARLAEARSRLAATEQNLTRCRDVIAELEPHARRLRSQAEKADRYTARRAELAALAGAYYRAALAESTARQEVAERRLACATDECEQLEAEIAERERHRLGGRDQLASLEAELAELRRRLEMAHRERDACLREVGPDGQRAGFVQARLEALAAETERAADRIGELAEASPEMGEADSVVESSAEQRQLESTLEALEAELRGARRQLESSRGGQIAAAQERGRIEREIEARRERQDRERLAEAAAEARRAELVSRLADSAASAAQLERDLAAGQVAAAAAGADLTATQAERQQTHQQLGAARQAEQGLRAELEVARAGLVAVLGDAEQIGAPRDAAAPPVRLAAALRAQPEVERAVAAALGEWARASVVADAEQAGAAIEGEASGRDLFLNESSGRATSSPDERFVEQVDRALRGLAYRLLGDCLETGRGRGRPLLGPLAYSLIVPDLATASLAAQRLGSLAYPWQVVTVDGRVLTWFGGCARGSESSVERLVSQRRREAEAQARMGHLQAGVEAASRAREEAEAAFGRAEQRERQAQAADLAVKSEVRLLARLRDDLSADRRRLEATLRGLPAPRSESSSASGPEVSELAAQRDLLSQRAAELARQEAAARGALPDLQARRDAAWSACEQVRRREAQAAAEQRVRRELRAERERELGRLREQQARASQQMAGLAAERDVLQGRLDELGRRSAELAEAIDRTGREVEGLAGQRARILAAAERLEAETASLRQRRTAAQSTRESALLARQQAADDLARLRQELEATAEEWGLLGPGWEGGAGPVQLRLLGEAPAVQPTGPVPGSREPEIDLAATRRRLVALQRELRGYGAISESVLEEFREVDGRLEFLNAQSADLRAAMGELESVIQELEGLMRQGFNAAFERVNVVFGQTFATLFGGGTARLALTEPDDPLRTGVDIVAQPPGKRLQGLMSLSGGERALTSTALIFALLAINPLPFCVLDEVDAALDESNARRFAALLQEYAERTQFIIITHNRATMETARTLYGITMGADAVTTVISLRPGEALERAPNGRAEHGTESVLQAR